MPSAVCFTDGLGPERFDCSGLIIRSIADVLGIDPYQDTPRHVRDMWHESQEQDNFKATEISAGSLAVVRRHYTIHGEYIAIPGHIGIITNAASQKIIHANPGSGKVETGQLRRGASILGYIAVNNLSVSFQDKLAGL